MSKSQLWFTVEIEQKRSCTRLNEFNQHSIPNTHHLTNPNILHQESARSTTHCSNSSSMQLSHSPKLLFLFSPNRTFEVTWPSGIIRSYPCSWSQKGKKEIIRAEFRKNWYYVPCQALWKYIKFSISKADDVERTKSEGTQSYHRPTICHGFQLIVRETEVSLSCTSRAVNWPRWWNRAQSCSCNRLLRHGTWNRFVF
jgi:hypothetical protein